MPPSKEVLTVIGTDVATTPDDLGSTLVIPVGVVPLATVVPAFAVVVGLLAPLVKAQEHSFDRWPANF